MNDTPTENELIERATKPRVTREQLDAMIVGETYTLLPNGRTTICQLTLANGFTVEGTAACVDIENYKEDIGNRFARERAVNEIWPLLGYELSTKLDLVAGSNPPSMPHFKTYVGTKVVHATPLNRREYTRLRAWDLPADENGDDEGYLIEYADGGQPNVSGFAGYVSWSPKDVFDASYQDLTGSSFKLPTTYVGRMQAEFDELIAKKRKLHDFIFLNAITYTDAFTALDVLEQERLKKQNSIMHDYASVLYDRIRFAKSQA